MTIASGQVGAKPGIYLWNGLDQSLIGKLPSKLTKGIQALSFSPSGNFLAAVAIDVDHSVALFNVQSKTQVGSSTGDKAQILDIAMKNDTTFATSGPKHFKLWTQGTTLTKKDGSFGTCDPRHAVCEFVGDYCLTGSLTGELYVWSGNSIKQAVKLHDQLLDCIHVAPNNLFTGGKDMKVCVLDLNNFTKLWEFSLATPQFNSVCARPRAIALNAA
jgi:WD40 repeat protein